MGVDTQSQSKAEQVTAHSTTISRGEIIARLQDPSFVLVNVMPKETFETGHIPHSINLPVAEVETKARKVFPRADQEITVYCSGPT
jgi:rhodanese-related sulfurtransferase